MQHCFFKEERLKDFGSTTVVGIELAVCIHSHFLVYPYLCDSGLLQPYVRMFFYSLFPILEMDVRKSGSNVKLQQEIQSFLLNLHAKKN